MFKTLVVSFAFFLMCAQLVAACSFTFSQTPTDVPSSATQTIAQEIANASSMHWQSDMGMVYVHESSDNDWLREALKNEFAKRQYTISADPNGSRQLEIATTNLGADRVHVSLLLDDAYEIDRVFHFELVSPNDTIEVPYHATGELVDYSPVERAVHTIIPESTNPTLNPESETSHQRSEVAQTPPQASPGGFDKASACHSTYLTKGSFKQNLERILSLCGWQLVGWPRDPANPDHELDWVVSTKQPFDIASIEDLARSLRAAFDLDVELNHTAKTVSTQLVK